MKESTTAVERREMRERAKEAHASLLAIGWHQKPFCIEPGRLLALLDEHEAQANEIAVLKARDRSMASACNEIAEAIDDVKRQMGFDEEATIHDVLDSFRSTASELHEVLEALKGARAEQDLDRAAVRALVEKLPRCEVGKDCERHATRDYNAPSERYLCCDEHAPPLVHPYYERYLEPLDCAAPLRALQARMASWGEAGAAVEAPAGDPGEGDDPHYRMVDVTSDPFGDDEEHPRCEVCSGPVRDDDPGRAHDVEEAIYFCGTCAVRIVPLPPEPDDEPSAYDAAVAERSGR